MNVVRKNICNVHLAVLPDGRVRIATPRQVADEQVRLLIWMGLCRSGARAGKN